MTNPKECNVCNEKFDENARCPRILPCSHYFCSECIGKLVSMNQKQCPFCRQPFEATSAKDLMVNRAVLNFMEYLQPGKRCSEEILTSSKRTRYSEINKPSTSNSGESGSAPSHLDQNRVYLDNGEDSEYHVQDLTGNDNDEDHDSVQFVGFGGGAVRNSDDIISDNETARDTHDVIDEEENEDSREVYDIPSDEDANEDLRDDRDAYADGNQDDAHSVEDWNDSNSEQGVDGNDYDSDDNHHDIDDDANGDGYDNHDDNYDNHYDNYDNSDDGNDDDYNRDDDDNYDHSDDGNGGGYHNDNDDYDSDGSSSSDNDDHNNEGWSLNFITIL